jgi:hypothetical protein
MPCLFFHTLNMNKEWCFMRSTSTSSAKASVLDGTATLAPDLTNGTRSRGQGLYENAVHRTLLERGPGHIRQALNALAFALHPTTCKQERMWLSLLATGGLEAYSPETLASRYLNWKQQQHQGTARHLSPFLSQLERIVFEHPAHEGQEALAEVVQALYARV